MSYIISNDKVVATTKENLESGIKVLFSSNRVEENVNASRDWNLVNAQTGVISNAKKWSEHMSITTVGVAEEIENHEFFIAQ